MASTRCVANAKHRRGLAGVTAGTRHAQTGNTGERISAGVCACTRAPLAWRDVTHNLGLGRVEGVPGSPLNLPTSLLTLL